jgi:hypothetical protein
MQREGVMMANDSATTKQIDRRRFIIKSGKWCGWALLIISVGPSAAGTMLEARPPVDRRLSGPEGDYTGV